MNYMHFGPSYDAGFLSALLPIFSLVLIWSLFWKIIALWNAAKRHEKGWFIAIMLINTIGILEIVYIFGVAKIKLEDLFKNF